VSSLSPPTPWPDLLAQARAGRPEAVGRLLEPFRPYLLTLAEGELDPSLRPKLGHSDLVQDSLLRAHERFEAFRGDSPEALRGWLRRILLRRLANWRRHFAGTHKRRLGRELPLGGDTGNGGPRPACPADTPSQEAARREDHALVREALDRLPDHYRQVLVWRSHEQLGFDEIGRRLDRSPDAARMLWGRAVEALEAELGLQP
jgi:RNA polymerase sigma-70 factor (ECF subfamily)